LTFFLETAYSRGYFRFTCADSSVNLLPDGKWKPSIFGFVSMKHLTCKGVAFRI